MAKRVDPLKAKQAKQKKMAIGLSVVFVAVLAYQVPKTMKMLKGPAAPVAAEAVPVPVPVSTTPGTPEPGAPAPAAGVPPVAGVSGADQPAVLVDSDLPVAPGDGQLLSFERFQAQDPFVQQVEAGGTAVTAPPADRGAQAPSDPAKGDPTPPSKPGDKPSGSIVPVTGSGSGPSPASPPGEAPVAVAAATTIALNGSPAALAEDGSFPADDPIFLLVSAAKDGRSVEIGIAGGSYADGEKTITLELGKKLTLQNTADGTRYELELLTVAGFAPPKPKR